MEPGILVSGDISNYTPPKGVVGVQAVVDTNSFQSSEYNVTGVTIGNVNGQNVDLGLFVASDSFNGIIANAPADSNLEGRILKHSDFILLQHDEPLTIDRVLELNDNNDLSMPDALKEALVEINAGQDRPLPTHRLRQSKLTTGRREL